MLKEIFEWFYECNTDILTSVNFKRIQEENPQWTLKDALISIVELTFGCLLECISVRIYWKIPLEWVPVGHSYNKISWGYLMTMVIWILEKILHWLLKKKKHALFLA